MHQMNAFNTKTAKLQFKKKSFSTPIESTTQYIYVYIYTVYTAKDEVIVALPSIVHNTELYHVFKRIKMENR